MGELSFLTIVVSLAVCSLLTYAIFQYMKVRLSILEQSHKEQAMILQQYIEESSTDIHRLYQMNTDSRQVFPQSNGSIILEYANEMMNEKQQQHAAAAAAAHNEPHTIHLDTAAFFHNSRGSDNGSKLIEISSDSEDTTETETDTEDETDTDTSDTDTDDEYVSNVKNNNEVIAVETEIDPTEITEVSTTEIKTVSVDLGSIQEPSSSSKEKPSLDVLSLLYKKAQDDSSTAVVDETMDTASAVLDVSPAADASASASASTSASASASVPLSAMSVSELKNLLKEKCKNQPEKHAEIQRLKKAELIYAIQQLQ
jgi:hypothetical protein